MAGDLVMGEATKGEGFSSSLVYDLIRLKKEDFVLKVKQCVWNNCTGQAGKISTGGDNFYTTI